MCIGSTLQVTMAHIFGGRADESASFFLSTQPAANGDCVIFRVRVASVRLRSGITGELTELIDEASPSTPTTMTMTTTMSDSNTIAPLSGSTSWTGSSGGGGSSNDGGGNPTLDHEGLDIIWNPPIAVLSCIAWGGVFWMLDLGGALAVRIAGRHLLSTFQSVLYQRVGAGRASYIDQNAESPMEEFYLLCYCGFVHTRALPVFGVYQESSESTRTSSPSESTSVSRTSSIADCVSGKKSDGDAWAERRGSASGSDSVWGRSSGGARGT